MAKFSFKRIIGAGLLASVMTFVPLKTWTKVEEYRTSEINEETACSEYLSKTYYFQGLEDKVKEKARKEGFAGLAKHFGYQGEIPKKWEKAVVNFGTYDQIETTSYKVSFPWMKPKIRHTSKECAFYIEVGDGDGLFHRMLIEQDVLGYLNNNKP